jgi:hypothetical protein
MGLFAHRWRTVREALASAGASPAAEPIKQAVEPAQLVRKPGKLSQRQQEPQDGQS